MTAAWRLGKEAQQMETFKNLVQPVSTKKRHKRSQQINNKVEELKIYKVNKIGSK